MLGSCRNNLQDKSKVQEAILARLQRSSGLDLKDLDVNTTDISFDKNLAYATVAFHPKEDSSVSSGMTMKYTLENRDGKWVVIKVGDSQGRGAAGSRKSAPGSTLPPGHPPVDGAASEQAK